MHDWPNSKELSICDHTELFLIKPFKSNLLTINSQTHNTSDTNVSKSKGFCQSKNDFQTTNRINKVLFFITQ